MIGNRIRNGCLAALACFAAACGGQVDEPTQQTNGPGHRPPDAIQPVTGSAASTTAAPSGVTSVTWSVLEPTGAGTITSTGVYTAPSTAGTYHVVVRSNLDQTKSASATVTVGSSSGSGWKLTFSDEFNDGVLDTSKWTTFYPATRAGGTGGRSNNDELEWYVDNAFTETTATVGTQALGVLEVDANKISAFAGTPPAPTGSRYQYYSGMINNCGPVSTSATPCTGGFSQLYGYFEMRAKIPKGQGFWPAFWLLPTDGSWPPEIDVMENLGNDTTTIYMTNHFVSGGVNSQAGSAYTGPDFSAGMHVYAVDWEPGSITWYIDAVQRFKLTSNVPNVPMYVIANLAVGGSWPGSPNASTVFPNEMDIDYIRCWQKTSSGGYPSIPGPTDPIPVP